jgi:hypothetical protein
VCRADWLHRELVSGPIVYKEQRRVEQR